MKNRINYILLSLFVFFLGQINFAFAQKSDDTDELWGHYKIGSLVCGIEAHVCPNPDWAWGMIIYVDPKPWVSGYKGIAMMLKDRTDNVPWVVDTYLQDHFVGADHYNYYGGKKNQRTFCQHDDSDCKEEFSPPDTSAFNACTTYRGGYFRDWYLPSYFETMTMFNVAQQMSYGANSKDPYECPSPYNNCKPHFFVDFQLENYWSSTEAYGFGANAPAPAANGALFMGLGGGLISGANDKGTISSVRCVRAIPII